VPFIDSTAAATIDGFVRKARRHGAAVYLAGARPQIHRVLIAHGVRPPDVHFAGSLTEALANARAGLPLPA
jgi:SulP family sulfate permease